MDKNLIGQSLGRYHIIEPLGEGGMATVYKAYDTRLETDVAVKVIRTEALPQNAVERALKRFEREAKSLAKLTHPNIVKVTDYGEYEGMPYLVMPYLPGGTLKKRLGKPMSWRDVVKVLIPVAEALDFAHNQGVVHRDVKPANILLTELGQPMLTDFGIAKILDTGETMELTGTGAFVGTPEYMAPEQATAKTADHRADIYSLGIVLYEMVTGRKPYQADTPFAVMIKQANDPLPRPSLFNPEIPKGVENILIKALAKKPEDRYQSMGEMVTALEGVMAGDGKSPKKFKEPKTPKEPSQAKPFNWQMIAGVIVILLATLAVVVVWQNRNIMTQLFLVNTPASTRTLMAALTSTGSNTLQPTATIKPSSTPDTSGLPKEISDPKGVTMRLVPAGEFIMGAQDGGMDDKPVRIVTLDRFYMDAYEVTNAQYKACVDTGSCKPPQNADSATRSSYYGNHLYDKFPVLYVDWTMSKAYCEWRGARLPTEAEWEKAARGSDARTYPWGNTNPSRGLLNYIGEMGDTIEVGSYVKGISPYGMYDMAGNVSEWVNDWYELTYYRNSPSSNPLGPISGTYRVLRGGSWNDTFKTISTNRDSLLPSGSNDKVGFRCASSNLPLTISETNTPDEQSVSPIVTPVSTLEAGEVLLEEDFEDQKAEYFNYTASTSKDWQILTDENGNYVFEINNKNGSDFPRAHFGSPIWENYSVDFRFRFLGIDQNSKIFLDFRDDGTESFSILIQPYYNEIKLAHGDPWTNLETAKLDGFKSETWYRVRVLVDGEKIKVYYDENPIISYVMSKDFFIEHGGCVFAVEPGAVAQFDDILVTVP